MFFKKKQKRFNFLEKVEDVIEDAYTKHKKKRNPFLKFLKYLFIFIIIFLILATSLSAVLFFKFKGIYDLAISGKSSLKYSVDSAKRKNFEEMLSSSKDSEKYFKEIIEELEFLRNSLFIKNFDFADEQIAEVLYLMESLRVISRSMEQVAVLAQEMDNVLSGNFGTNFSEFSNIEKERILKLLYESSPELNGVRANLDLALINLKRVEAKNIFHPIADKIKNIRDESEDAVATLSKAMIASQIIPELAGYSNGSTFLVLFQNNTELRPTGGFLGTYGILETKNGEIVRFDTHDIYHMDMPLEQAGNFQIVPPKPIAKYLNKNWYLRDSNWAPDFPTSARQIEWFYNKENGLLPEENQINNFSGEFDGIIAVTPDLIVDLLDMLGEINIDGEEFNKDNFVELLQYKVEQDFVNQNIASWQRKEVIGDILEELKIRLLNLRFDAWPWAVENINESLRRKDILVFFKDKYLQKLAIDMGIAGEMKDAPRDYLMVVDSNMAALKTDAVMKKEIKYNLVETEAGLVVRLRINYVHEGKESWKVSDYKTYTRIYVPIGSKLIKAEGASGDIEIKEEFGKTSFGGFFTVKIGRSGSLYFEYKLPKEIERSIKEDGYNIYIQKQPGSKVQSLELDVELLNEVKSYNPSGFNAEGELLTENRVRWITDMDIDKEFKINF